MFGPAPLVAEFSFLNNDTCIVLVNSFYELINELISETHISVSRNTEY